MLHAFNPAQQSIPAPWSLTFDLRERETDWTEENKVVLQWEPLTRLQRTNWSLFPLSPVHTDC